MENLSGASTQGTLCDRNNAVSLHFNKDQSVYQSQVIIYSLLLIQFLFSYWIHYREGGRWQPRDQRLPALAEWLPVTF